MCTAVIVQKKSFSPKKTCLYYCFFNFAKKNNAEQNKQTSQRPDSFY